MGQSAKHPDWSNISVNVSVMIHLPGEEMRKDDVYNLNSSFMCCLVL